MLYRLDNYEKTLGWIEVEVHTPARIRAALRAAGFIHGAARLTIEDWGEGRTQIRHRDTEHWLIPATCLDDFDEVPLDFDRIYSADRPAPFAAWHARKRPAPRRRATALDPLASLLDWAGLDRGDYDD